MPGPGRHLDRLNLRRIRSGEVEDFSEVGVARLQVPAHDRHVVLRPGVAARVVDARDLREVVVERPDDDRVADDGACLPSRQTPANLASVS
jgi:hypothetical protein